MPDNEHIHVKVSVITVVRNAVDKIESTVKSVLAQDYDNVEYIVVDGCSTDGTLEIIGRYRDKFATFVSENDNGIYDALNKGVMMATGEWIGIMNAGDVFASNDVLSKVFGVGRHLDGVGVVYGDAIALDGGVEQCCRASEVVSDLEKGPCYRHGASFVRRDIHRKYLFDLAKKPLISFALDYEQIFRMYKGGVLFKKVPYAVIKYELRGASTVSPFKSTYYNYLITHDMKCGVHTKLVLVLLTLWRGTMVTISRFLRIVTGDKK